MNNEVISKVKNVSYEGEWASNYGTLHQFYYQMEDGAKLIANHKDKERGFNIGDDVVYVIKGDNSKYGKYGSVARASLAETTIFKGADYSAKKDAAFWEKKDKAIKVGHAINNAVHICIAQNSVDKGSIIKWAKSILEISEELNSDKPVPSDKVKEKIAATVAALDVDDDLPF